MRAANSKPALFQEGQETGGAKRYPISSDKDFTRNRITVIGGQKLNLPQRF